MDDPRVKEIQEERGYTYSDIITCSPEKLPGYETKILSFFEEHIHTDEEIRYCVDGSGYFDIRDEDDRYFDMMNKLYLLFSSRSYSMVKMGPNCIASR